MTAHIRCPSFRIVRCLAVAASIVAAALVATPAVAQRSAAVILPQWIWSPEHKQGDIPQTSCYFRKTIHLPAEHQGFIEIAADDVYELHVNGKLIGTGGAWQKMKRHEITSQLKQGKNVVAVKVTNRNGNYGGLAARVVVESEQGQQRRYVSNQTWRTNLKVLPMWDSLTYRDARWNAAQSFGAYGQAKPWSNQSNTPAHLTSNGRQSSADTGKRQLTSVDGNHPEFRLPQGFEIQHVVGNAQTGSLIALAFNEFGEIYASREGGPLLEISDSNENGVPDAVRVCCDKVQSCQGILPLSGTLYVVGDGPSGVALYRLSDGDLDGNFESVTAVLQFQGKLGEHGPHGLVLGPDGMIYVSIGNHSKLKVPYSPTSPHRNYYDGELVTPKYEDPRGHAAGITAPGGGVLRVDPKGSRVELFAGGIRNAYDLAFNPDGELFVHDSDMESDAGTPWHRNTRLMHVTAGGEFGWRSGWSKWPDYYVDVLPGLLDTGRGSPTGCVFYEHDKYPEQYRNRLFSCDWAQGEIVSFKLNPQGASFSAEKEVFLRGRPLNVTDIDVGPDGWLYFCTGGRGTRGNLYRVVWTKPEEARQATGMAKAMRQPQPRSAWGRQAVAAMRQELNREWDTQIRTLALTPSYPADDRATALQLMHLVGPPPSDTELARLARDESPAVRRRAAHLMGLIGNKVTSTALLQLLADADPHVQRTACESLARAEVSVPLDALRPLLTSDDRFLAWAARRLLERSSDNRWQDRGVASSDLRLFLQTAVATLVEAPSTEAAKTIMQRAISLSNGFVPADDLRDVIRVMQLAQIRGNLPQQPTPELLSWARQKFPTKDHQTNREFVRLFTRMQVGQMIGPMLALLDGKAAQEEKVHVGTHLRFIKGGWSPQQKTRLLRFYEDAQKFEGGTGFALYINRVARDFTQTLSPGEQQAVIRQADRLPKTAIVALFALDEKNDAKMIPQLIELDRRLAVNNSEEYEELRIAIVAILARSGEPDGKGYLREIYDRDPNRRALAAMGLAQDPGGRNWDYLVRSIPLLEGEPAVEVLTKLREVEYAPESPEHLRQVILAGLRLKGSGGMAAAQLLEHWIGQRPPPYGNSWNTALSAWQRWFEATYPNRPLAKLPVESGNNVWTYDDLLTFLSSREGSSGSAARGAAVYRKAQCADCHVHGRTGKDFGPDLTDLAKRFQRQEVLEAIVYPSQVISDQYQTSLIYTTDGRTIEGLLVPGAGQQKMVLTSEGKTIRLLEKYIEEVHPSKLSSMPEGLLNQLALPEIADLFAFLMQAPQADLAKRPENNLKN